MFDIRQEVVRALADSVQRGGRSLGNVPALLVRVIEENMWQRRIVDDREIVVSEFREFVALPYPEGLGTTIETLEALCQHEPDIMDFLAQAKRGKVGAPLGNNHAAKYEVDARGNVIEKTKLDNIKNSFASGTSAEYAYNKLRDEAYDDSGAVKNPKVASIQKRVLAGEITPHRGMVEAGFRENKIPVIADNPKKTASTLIRKMSREHLTELVQLPAEHLADTE